MKCAIVIRLSLTAFFSLAFLHGMAQTTPAELGSTVIDVFRSRQFHRLDTLVITGNQLIDIFRLKGGDMNSLPHDAAEKHDRQVSRFKAKCERMVNDTSYFKIDWNAVVFEKAEVIEYVSPAVPDSLKNSDAEVQKRFNIYFTDLKENYVIRFKRIYEHNGKWKLGKGMVIRKAEDVSKDDE